MIFKGLDNDAMVLVFKGVLQRVENGDLDPIKRQSILQRMKLDRPSYIPWGIKVSGISESGPENNRSSPKTFEESSSAL